MHQIRLEDLVKGQNLYFFKEQGNRKKRGKGYWEKEKMRRIQQNSLYYCNNKTAITSAGSTA
jgi:hypothetical protein